jgi:hypothetical protein
MHPMRCEALQAPLDEIVDPSQAAFRDIPLFQHLHRLAMFHDLTLLSAIRPNS